MWTLCKKSTWISYTLELLCGYVPGINSAKVFHPKSWLTLPGGYDLATDRADEPNVVPNPHRNDCRTPKIRTSLSKYIKINLK